MYDNNNYAVQSTLEVEVFTLAAQTDAVIDWDVDAAEAQFMDLERDAAEIWSLDLDGGVEADLADLQGDTAFNGFTDQGTWWLGFRCSGCTHPAPRFLTRVVLGEEP